MKYKELEGKKIAELQTRLSKARAALYNFRLQTSVNQLRDVSQIKKTRREVALLTKRIGELTKEESK